MSMNLSTMRIRWKRLRVITMMVNKFKLSQVPVFDQKVESQKVN